MTLVKDGSEAARVWPASWPARHTAKCCSSFHVAQLAHDDWPLPPCTRRPFSTAGAPRRWDGGTPVSDRWPAGASACLPPVVDFTHHALPIAEADIEANDMNLVYIFNAKTSILQTR